MHKGDISIQYNEVEKVKLKQIVTVLFATMFFCTPIRAEQNKKWYEENRLVAHALGAIEDKKEIIDNNLIYICNNLPYINF